MKNIKTEDPAKLQDVFFIRTVLMMKASRNLFSEESKKDVDTIINTTMSFISSTNHLSYVAGYLQESVIDLLPEDVREKYANLFYETVENTITNKADTVEKAISVATTNLLYRNAKIYTFKTSSEECIETFQNLVACSRKNLLESMKQPDYWYGYGQFGGILEDLDKVLKLDATSFKNNFTGYLEKVLEVISDAEMLLTHLSAAIYISNDLDEKTNKISAKVFLRLILLTGSSDYYLNERFQFYRKR